jgi:hypothetical protein
LNINLHPGHDGGERKAKSVHALHLSRSEYRVMAKAKFTSQTFTAIDLANKANIVKNGHRVASKAYEVTRMDGETGKVITPMIYMFAVCALSESPLVLL